MAFFLKFLYNKSPTFINGNILFVSLITKKRVFLALLKTNLAEDKYLSLYQRISSSNTNISDWLYSGRRVTYS